MPNLDEEVSAARKKVVTDSYDMSVGELVNLYKEEELTIDPVFQRLFRWDDERKTRFVESLLLGIPLPPIFVFQDENGIWELVDGLQRLSTLFQLTGDLKGERAEELGPLILNGTRYLPSLRGKRWEDSAEGAGDGIGQKLQISIKRARLRVEIIRNESDQIAKFELFQRLNTGGVRLTEQEVRNSIAISLNRGFYDWLAAQAANPAFVTTTDQTERALDAQAGTGVALLYAHWEGFIKAASEAYLNFVNNQHRQYRELKSCFAVFGLKSRLATLAVSRQIKPNIEIFEFVVGELDKPARMNMLGAIDTESNLSSRVFSNIANSLDIVTTAYETKFNLIDKNLLDRRNKVAHGEYVDLEMSEFHELVDEVLALMRGYKTDLENAATLAGYLRQPPVTSPAASPAPSAVR